MCIRTFNKYIICNKWSTHKIFGKTTTNIWITEGGIAANVIASKASSEIVIRCSVNTDIIENKIKLFIKKYDIDNQITFK